MPRYRLRTLLIVLALGPPVLAGAYWRVERQRLAERLAREAADHYEKRRQAWEVIWAATPNSPPSITAEP